MTNVRGVARAALVAALGLVFAACSACAGTAAGMAAGPRAGGAVVLVAGATGGTGREVVRQALARGYRVRALVRDEAKAREIFADTVQYAVGDVKDAGTLPAAVKGATYVVSALGSNSRREPANKPEFVDFGGVASLAKAAKSAGVRQFVLVSSMGVTDPDHPLNRILDNIMSFKLKGEDALRASGVPYTVVRPGELKDLAGGGALRFLQGDAKGVRGQTTRADVATACVEALGRKDALNKTFEMLGDPAGAPVDWSKAFAGLHADAH
jgi:uncharacterized protein YbjT (DUF2867 family)